MFETEPKLRNEGRPTFRSCVGVATSASIETNLNRKKTLGIETWKMMLRGLLVERVCVCKRERERERQKESDLSDVSVSAC